MTASHPILRPLFLVLCSFIAFKAKSQSFSFSHINTSNGLSENNVQSVAIDKKGFLWIGTTDGLNVYDGYMVTVYNLWISFQNSETK